MMASVVGLIIPMEPLPPALSSVNQRLPSGPAAISVAVVGTREGELGDRQQATIFQPFEPNRARPVRRGRARRFYRPDGLKPARRR